MKTILSLLLSISVSAAALADNIVVKVVDDKGLPVQKADVVAILKSGAYQDAKLDAADGQHKCQPTVECVKIYAAAPGYEAAMKKYTGEQGVVSLQLKPNTQKSSTIARTYARFEGIEGKVRPKYNSSGKWHMYAEKIGFAEKKNGNPVGMVNFELNSAIDAVTNTGLKFKIYVLDINPGAALVEYSIPK